MSLGAYFGSTKITQGAGGLGQDGPLQAYADGIVGGNAPSAENPGPLFAYADGSLGAAPLQAFVDGVVGGSSANPDMPGSLFAYEDGSLGPLSRGAPYADAPDGGVFGGGGGGGSADGGSIEMADHPAPVLAYQDGVFGGRGTCGLGAVGPLRAYSDGSLGSDDDAGGTPISVFGQGIFGEHGEGMNRFGPLQSFHDGSLGAVGATAPGLDLGDEQTLMELKVLLGMSSAFAMSPEGQKTYTPEWYRTGIWEPSASALWQSVVNAPEPYGRMFVGQKVSDEEASQTWPNGTGIFIMFSTLMTPDAGFAARKKAMEEQLPTLSGWFAAAAAFVQAKTQSCKEGQACPFPSLPVLGPYLSLTDKVKGAHAGAAGGSMKMGAMAWYGLGAAALLGVALVFRKKR